MQRTCTTQHKKQPQFKNGWRAWKDIFHKIYRWTTEALKIFDISNHQRNVNQDHNEMLSHTCEWLSSSRQQTSRVGQLEEKMWDCKLVQPICKMVQMCLWKLKIDQAMSYVCDYEKKGKYLFQKKMHVSVQCSIACYSQDVEST